MSKFRIKLKLQGLELEVEGSREQAPQIAENLSRQIGGIFGPAAHIVTGDGAVEVPEAESAPLREALPAPAKRKKSTRRRATTVSAGAASADGDALDWRHDSARWGVPQQGWKTATKAIWLLYVAGEATGTAELSAGRIASTFNKHFKQANAVLPHNVSRDLGRQKLKNPAPVGEDASQNPSLWYLTDEGRRQAKALIADAQAGDDGDRSN